jgi:hypothetical protein
MSTNYGASNCVIFSPGLLLLALCVQTVSSYSFLEFVQHILPRVFFFIIYCFLQSTQDIKERNQ